MHPSCAGGRALCAASDPEGFAGPRSGKNGPMDEIKNTDDAKGRLKEGVGDITGDQDLKNEGKVDKATGGVKDAVDGAADKVKGALGKD